MAIDIEALKAKLAQMNNKGKGGQKFKSDLWTPGLGSHFARAVPWPTTVAVGDSAPFVERWFYYALGKRIIAQPLNAPDPVRELRDALFADRNDVNLALARQLKPKMRCYLPVIVLAEEDDAEAGVKKGDKIVRLWGLSATVYKELLSYLVDPDYGDITDPVSGFDLTVEISDSGKKFDDGTPIRDVKPRLRPRPRALDADELALIDAVPDINSIYPISSYEQLENALTKFVDGSPSGQQETRGTKTQDAVPQPATQTKPSRKSTNLDDAFKDLIK